MFSSGSVVVQWWFSGGSVLFWVTELVILAYIVSTGIFLVYPNVIDENCDEFSDD